MKPCIIESPFAGDFTANKAYLQNCIRWCIDHGWTPYASHQMLTDALDDCDEDQRDRGLNAGLAMSRVLARAGAPWLFFVDRGVSRGMMAAQITAACSGTLVHAVSISGQHELQRVSHGDFCTWWAPRVVDHGFSIFASLWTPDAGWSDGDAPAGWRP